MKAWIQGKAPQWPEGYEGFFKDWAEQNKTVMERWSAEERSQSFVRFLEHGIQLKNEALILRRAPVGAEKQRLRKLNQEGQLILAMNEQGKQEILTPEELKSADPLKLKLISTSLISQTTDLEEVRQEQMITHVTLQLENAHFYVTEPLEMNEAGEMVGRVQSPRHNTFDLKVLLGEGPMELVFTDPKSQNSTRLNEKTLGMSYGQLPIEMSEDALVLGEESLNAEETADDQSAKIRAGGLAAVGALELMQSKLNQNAAATQHSKKEEAQLLSHIQEASLLRNNLSNRTAHSARADRQETELKTEQERIEKRKKDQYEALYKKEAERRQAQEEEEKEQRSQRTRRRRGAALATSAGVGLLGAMGSGAYIVFNTTLNILQS